MPVQDGGPVSWRWSLRRPSGGNPADAINYLGGIADVLENKSHRGTLDHLGLAVVGLYANDHQIKQISYRELADNNVSYTVTVQST